MKGRSGRAALFAALLLGGGPPGAAPAAPQAPPPAAAPPRPAPEEAVFGERIDVRAVDVEVVVTDASGKRVRGLAAADFRLLVDGKEERIDSFAEVVEGQAAPAAPASAAPDVPAASAAVPEPGAGAPVPAPAPARVGINYLVFVDDAFAVSSQRNAALATLERDLALLAPGDRMAVVAYDGKGLSVLAPWTGDAAALRKAFAQAAARPAQGAHIVAERRGDERADRTAAEDLYEDADLLSVNPFTEKWARDHHTSGVGRVATAAADALRGMPRPPGRRVMMLLAGGWPWDGDARPLLPLTTAANLLGYTLYPVYVTGFDPLVEAADAEGRARGIASDSRGMSNAPVLSGWEKSSEIVLTLLARATGGVAALDRDHALRQVAEDARSYYRLGFSPVWKANDRSHAIRVEARRPGLTVRSRRGYFDLSEGAAAALTAESILFLGTGDPARRQLTVTAGAPRKVDRDTVELPLTFGIPSEALTRLPGAGRGYPLEGLLAVASLDTAGGRATLPGQTLRGTLPEPPRPGVGVRIRSTLRLRNAPQRLVFTVTGTGPGSGGPIWTDLDFQP